MNIMYNNNMKHYLCILLLVLCFILCFVLFYVYQKDNYIKQILYNWKRKVKNGDITFDGIGNYNNDYYLSLTPKNNFYTHIHLITDNKQYYLCYVDKKNNKHSQLYIIDANKDPNIIVNEMLTNFKIF